MSQVQSLPLLSASSCPGDMTTHVSSPRIPLYVSLIIFGPFQTLAKPAGIRAFNSESGVSDVDGERAK